MAMQVTYSGEAANAERPNRRALGAWTLRRLYELIFSGELSPGDLLVEAELTERLGVSRSPLRDALRQLELDRLVKPHEVNGKRVVVAFGVDDVAELYTVRAALEVLGFRTAAARISDAELEGLAQAQAAMEQAARDRGSWDPRDFEADFRFHEIVCLAARMPRLHAQLSTLWIQTWALLRQLHAQGIYPDAGEDALAFRDHYALIEALRARDPDRAGRAVEQHLTERRDHLIAAVQRHGGLPGAGSAGTEQ